MPYHVIAGDVRPDVLTGVSISITIFWDVASCIWLNEYQLSGGTWYLHLQSLPWKWRQRVPLNRWHTSDVLHVATSQKTEILIWNRLIPRRYTRRKWVCSTAFLRNSWYSCLHAYSKTYDELRRWIRSSDSRRPIACLFTCSFKAYPFACKCRFVKKKCLLLERFSPSSLKLDSENCVVTASQIASALFAYHIIKRGMSLAGWICLLSAVLLILLF
jgi:hypothetical protein